METIPPVNGAKVYDMDWGCYNCGGEDKIPFPDSKTCEAVFVVCSHCSHPSAYGWCEECGAGIQLEWIDFRPRPAVWHCKDCGTEYQLPADFYENPIRFRPVAFADIEKIRETRFIRKYGHVDVVWIQRGLLLWRKVKDVPMITALALFLLVGLLLAIFQPSPPAWMAFVALFALILLGMTFLMNLVAFLVSKVFLVKYKIDKKWNG
jgi:hypothetical protein